MKVAVRYHFTPKITKRKIREEGVDGRNTKFMLYLKSI